jgi:hypothetical protein
MLSASYEPNGTNLSCKEFYRSCPKINEIKDLNILTRNTSFYTMVFFEHG